MLPLLLACHPHVNVNFLQPADVTLPDPIVYVAVIDPVGSTTSQVLAGAIKADLYESTRLLIVDGRPPSGQLPLSQAEVQTLCASAKAEGLVVVESADLDAVEDTRVREREVEKNGETRTIKEYTVERTWTAQAGLSLLGCDGSTVDSVVLTSSGDISGTGRSAPAARDNIDPTDEAELQSALLGNIGADYVAHLVPTWATGRRPYFRNGHPDLVEGHQALQADKLQIAERQWTAVWDTSTDPKEKGRAAFNLAVLAELREDVPAAVRWLKAARDQLGDDPMVERYRAVLRARKRSDKVVDEQLQWAR